MHRIPSIDHSLLSPSGKMSKLARKQAMAREAAKLFPPGFWTIHKTEDQIRQEKIESLLNSAATLEALADRGMGVKKHRRAAAKLRLEAESI